MFHIMSSAISFMSKMKAERPEVEEAATSSHWLEEETLPFCIRRVKPREAPNISSIPDVPSTSQTVTLNDRRSVEVKCIRETDQCLKSKIFFNTLYVFNSVYVTVHLRFYYQHSDVMFY